MDVIPEQRYDEDEDGEVVPLVEPEVLFDDLAPDGDWIAAYYRSRGMA